MTGVSIPVSNQGDCDRAWQRRRIRTEDKAKVVAAVWRTEFDPIPCCTIAILHQDDMKKRINRITAILGGMDALKK